jgi:parallel beta-helix repeat protein/predicted outer membrane repeat protein
MFIVDSLATLLAVGNESDSIYFTSDDPLTSWNGIRFLTSSGSSRVSYCLVEYGDAIGSGLGTYGGAIYCYRSDLTISHSAFVDNFAEIGGGAICCREGNPTIRDNLIRNNSADFGGGIFCREASPVIEGNLIRYNSCSRGGGIYCWKSSPTVCGNTIKQNAATREGGGICCDDQANATIDGNAITLNLAELEGGGIYCEDSQPAIRNNIISENPGGGIHCYHYSDPIIENNVIAGNAFTTDGGGIVCQFHSSPVICNNIIVSNSAPDGYGGGIYCTNYCDPSIRNNTLSANLAVYGGGICCRYYSNPTIINTILWADIATEGQEIFIEEGSSPIVTYCDVEGGWQGEGNIDIDPLFRDPQEDNFHLMADYCGDPDNSPCIDVGHPDSTDVILSCLYGLGSGRADMGAYGGRNSGWPTGIEDDDKGMTVPERFLLLQNHPNPFNAITVIEYQVPINGCVKLEIYNMLGQKVATLVDSKQQTGYRSVMWDALGVSSGLYFYKLTAGDQTETKKMTLVK